MISKSYIINYGCGNIVSVRAWMKKKGLPCYLANNVGELRNITQDSLIILPGVGNYGVAAKKLKALNFDIFLNNIRGSLPIVGICLGAQIMFESSEESVGDIGLSWIGGNVLRLPASQCPRLGWFQSSDSLASYSYDGIEDPANQRLMNILTNSFYYNHSYFIDPQSMKSKMIRLSKACNGIVNTFLTKDRLLGVQYHPEKSQSAGQDLLDWIIKEL